MQAIELRYHREGRAAFDVNGKRLKLRPQCVSAEIRERRDRFWMQTEAREEKLCEEEPRPKGGRKPASSEDTGEESARESVERDSLSKK
jgi:hypothetical protein